MSTPKHSPPRWNMMVCFARCVACIYDSHSDPREWHTWADDDDVAYAESIGQDDPRDRRCSCWCADETGAEPIT